MFNGVVVYGETESGFFEQLEDNLITMHLTHYASELLRRGFNDEAELDSALHKAIGALTRASQPVVKHFREVYVSEGPAIKKDWMVSELGYRLIIFNADISNPVVAKLQVELLANHIS